MTGLRQGELLALRWSDVDWIASRVRVAESFTRGAFDSPKSHRGRSVPMADRLAGELERHFQRSYWRRDQDLVFAHPATGHVLVASRVRKRFRAALGLVSSLPAAPLVARPRMSPRSCAPSYQPMTIDDPSAILDRRHESPPARAGRAGRATRHGPDRCEAVEPPGASRRGHHNVAG
jgi:hypothetical protein